MRQFTSPWRIVSARLIFSQPIKSRTPFLLRIPRCSTQGIQFAARLQSTKAAPNASKTAEEAAKRLAKDAGGNPGRSYEIAEKLLIYHGGTGRTTFLAMIKVTTLFVSAFFCFAVVPGYIKADKPFQETFAVAWCGILPLVFIAYITAPFVTHVHIHLPEAARASRAALERFVRSSPPSTELTVTTMSMIGKPRYSSVVAGDLFPARRRFGVVNYTRDTAAENAARKWYMFRAVGNFHIQDGTGAASSPAKAAAGPGKKSLVEGWIWDVIRGKIQRRAGGGLDKGV